MINLILCGGSGTRLWPVSRSLMPKQFYPLFHGRSLFEETILRNKDFCREFWIASNKDQIFLAFEQLAKNNVSIQRGLIEPVARNTAPAIALVCLSLPPETVVFVTPSDHLIVNEEAYRDAVTRARTLAEAGKLVTFGIQPSGPETGYGYIEAQGEAVKSFREKPDAKTAADYLAKGNYYWNSGMFVFKAGVFLNELKTHSPDVYKTCKAAWEPVRTSNPLVPVKDLMELIPSISIDYAVMEKSHNVAVVPCDIGWSDLGSFDALYEVTHDKNTDNAIITKEAPVCVNARQNLLISESRKVALVDVEDLLVVDSEDALLVVKRGSSQKVKEVVEQLKSERSSLLEAHTTVHRPWGSYTVLQDQPNFKVKRLDVLPGKRLSLQKHERRQEHWVVAAGTAHIQIDQSIGVYGESQHIFIPKGSLHRLENSGTGMLTIIETQLGDYFGEDDIIRVEDDFHRV